MCGGCEEGVALLTLSNFLKYPMNMKQFGLPETNLFHFRRIFKNVGRGWGGGGGSSEK